MKGLNRKETVVKFSRSIRLHLAGFAAIAVLSGCGNGSNPLALSPALDTTPPPAPENLSLANDASGHPVLVWSESAAIDVVGYQVYVYGAAPGGGNDYIPADDVLSVDPIFRLPSVITNVEASYRVRAVDASGNWSAFSATADILIPVAGGGGGTDPFEIQ